MAPESISSILEKEQEVHSTLKSMTFEEVLVIRGVAVKHQSTIFPILDQQGLVISLGKVSLNITPI